MLSEIGLLNIVTTIEPISPSLNSGAAFQLYEQMLPKSLEGRTVFCTFCRVPLEDLDSEVETIVRSILTENPMLWKTCLEKILSVRVDKVLGCALLATICSSCFQEALS
jgi:hypothetical protein